MKILLINPIQYDSIENFVKDSKTRKINSDECLSLGYISSYVKQQLPEIEIEVFDWHISCLECIYEYNLMKKFSAEWIRNSLKKKLYRKDFEQILINKIKEYKPEIVGISGNYEYSSQPFLETLEIIKNIDKNIITVAGGLYATTFKDELKNNELIDYIIIGEGEIEFYKLVKNIYNIKDFDNLEIIYYNNFNCEYIQNLDNLPLPDRDNLSIPNYSIYGRQVSDRIYKENCKTVTIEISRGCSLKCIYCSGHKITNRDYRIRSIENIVNEIKYLKEKYNPEIFNFNEENPNINIKHTKELYKALIPLKIKWISNAGFYVSNLDREFVELAMKSGLLFWNLAIESGSKRMLKIMKKPTNIPEKAKQVVKWIREIDDFIYINSFWMFGFAEETWEDINESIELMRELNIDWFQINFLNVHRGSDLYNKYRDQGLIKEIDNKDNHYLESKVKNIHGIDKKDISDYVYEKINIDLNFRNNRCMRVGNYEQALRDMKHVYNITNGKHKLAGENIKLIKRKLDEK